MQTSVNRRIVTEEDLIRWLSTLFTRADWQPEALVMVGSGGDDELMPVLEEALSVPVFAPAEAQLALARRVVLSRPEERCLRQTITKQQRAKAIAPRPIAAPSQPGRLCSLAGCCDGSSGSPARCLWFWAQIS